MTRAWKAVGPGRDEQFALKRAELLKQAARAFNAHGYHETSLDQVAKVLGVTKPALYYYIKNKQEILFECHVLSVELADRAIDGLAGATGSAFDRLIQLMRHYVEMITGELGAFAVLTEFDALEPANRKLIAQRRARMNSVVRELIAEGVADGSIRSVDPKVTTLFFLGSLNWMMRWFDPAGPLTNVQIAAQFTDLLGEALKRR